MSNSENDDKETLASRIVNLVAENVTLFHDQDGRGYAVINQNGYPEVLKIKSEDFTRYIAFAAWTELDKPLVSATKDTVTATLEAMARFDGKQHELQVRVAWHEKALWYDLGRKAVKITGDGWEIVNEPPILFKRFAHQKPQIEPIAGGDMENILNYMNIPPVGDARKEMAILILTYLVSVLIPDVPRPIMAVSGLPGAAKSTFFRVIKNLVDPSSLETLTYPRNSHELIQMLSHHYLICFDNLTELDNWQSDELCKAVTGQAFSKRMLFTDDDDVIYSYKRALGLNGINLVARKSDLLDRSLIFELQPISKDTRKSEEAFWIDFEKERPKMLGAIFTTLAKAMNLKNRGLIKLEKKPRLADYAVWSSAAAVSLGHTIEYFTDALRKNVERQNGEAIDASPIAQVIIDYMTDQKRPIQYSSKYLFDKLKERAETLGLNKDKEFPKTQGWLWRKIKPIKGNLQNIGIEAKYFDNVRPREIYLGKIDGVWENTGDDVGDGGGLENQGNNVTQDVSMTAKTPSSPDNIKREPKPNPNGSWDLDPEDVGLSEEERRRQKWQLDKQIRSLNGSANKKDPYEYDPEEQDD